MQKIGSVICYWRKLVPDRFTDATRQARATARAIIAHAEACPARRSRANTAAIPACQLAEIVAWMGEQWADTWSFDYETAAIKFDVPEPVLRAEVTRYLRARAGYGRDSRN